MVQLSAKQLVEKYRQFFEDKGHKWIPSASLVPEDDSSALFISAGMHPLIPYLLGEAHPLGKRLVNVQECLRTVDIDKVGDTFHHTWFEMLGNWSLGDYFKKEMISWSFEFLTEVLKIDPAGLHVTCFAGDDTIPRDEETFFAWKKVGIDKKRIYFLPKKDNWWGPVGETGPCGPDTEMFIDTGKPGCGRDCRPGCPCGRYIEIWNDVFMEYSKNRRGEYKLLKQKNVDTGMGVERTLAVVSGLEDNYLTDIWQPIVKKIEEVFRVSYQKEKNKRPIRIIADHLRSAVFVLADGVLPSNKEQGYVLRRLIRRAVRQGILLGADDNFTEEIARVVIDNQTNYDGIYPEINNKREAILESLREEEVKFKNTLARGLKEVSRLIKSNALTPLNVFNIYQTYGFPLELIEEEARQKFRTDFIKEFNQIRKKHQELSRTAAKGRFKGGLSTSSPKTIRYHTLTHLLGAALRTVLGDHVRQKGSNITEERVRFDFNHPKKLTSAEIKRIEALVNQKIEENLAVRVKTMPLSEAQKSGAIAVPGVNYPDEVKVYSIGDFSQEICGGPHVTKTGELGRFKITREEGSGSGTRRIYGILE